MIDRRRGGPVFRQLARLLRAQITSGVLKPGDRLPSEKWLSQEHGVGLDSASAAIGLLRSEGLVVTRAPQGTFVRVQPERQEFSLQRGSTVVLRMPTPEEADEFDLDEGVPVAEIKHGARTFVIPGDRFFLIAK